MACRSHHSVCGSTAPASMRDMSSRSSISLARRFDWESITSATSACMAGSSGPWRRVSDARMMAVSGVRRSCEIACRIAVLATSARFVASASVARASSRSRCDRDVHQVPEHRGDARLRLQVLRLPRERTAMPAGPRSGAARPSPQASARARRSARPVRPGDRSARRRPRAAQRQRSRPSRSRARAPWRAVPASRASACLPAHALREPARPRSRRPPGSAAPRRWRSWNPGS